MSREYYILEDSQGVSWGGYYAQGGEEAWIRFAQREDRENDHPRYKNEDLGEELAAVIECLQEDGWIVRLANPTEKPQTSQKARLEALEWRLEHGEEDK